VWLNTTKDWSNFGDRERKNVKFQGYLRNQEEENYIQKFIGCLRVFVDEKISNNCESTCLPPGEPEAPCCQGLVLPRPS